MIGLSGKKSYSSAYLVLVGVAAAVLLGIAVVRVDVGTMGIARVLLFPLGLLLLVPFFVTIFRRRPINFLEPIFVVVFGYGLFLFVRPLYILSFNDFETMNFLGASKEAIPLAIFFSILGLSALYFGYYSSVGPSLARALPAGRSEVSPKQLRNWSVFVLILGLLLYGTFLRGPASGSLASESLAGSAYFYLGIDIAAVGVLLLFHWTLISPRWRRILLITLFITIFIVGATYLGSRYRVLYLGLTLIASYYLFRNRALSFRGLVYWLPLAFLYVAGVGLLRGGERRVTAEKITGLETGTALQRFVSSGGDLNIFDTFTRILTVVPETVPFVMPGRTFLYLFVAFVPRSLWPGKPLPTELLMNREAIGDIGAVAANTGYSYSLPGSFYIEGGVVTLLLGAFIFGVFCRTIWSYYLLNGTFLSRAALAVSLPYLLLSQRGGFNDTGTVWYLTYLVPVIVGFYYAGRKRRSRDP